MDALLPVTHDDPDGLAVDDGRLRWTWNDLELESRRVAHALSALGLEPGERWGLLSYNRAEWISAILGNFRAGTGYVPLNWHLTAPELAYVLDNSEARFVVTDPEHEGVAREAAGERRVLVVDADWADLVAAQPTSEPPDEAAGSVMNYTSGTTGRQKGVVRGDSGGRVADAVDRYRAVGDFWRFTEGGRHLVVCPLYHAAPPACALFALTHGQSLIVTPRFDAAAFLRLVEDHGVTSTHVVPTQMIRLLRLPDGVRAGADVSSLDHVLHGAAPCPSWAKRAMIEWLGPVVYEYMGSSEGTGPIIATSEEWLERPGTVGRPAPWLEVFALDDEHRELPPGEVGTLWFRSRNGPPSYHGDPEKTRNSQLPDGRYTVGDFGSVDADGYVYLADRRVDLILSGGVNVYPSEVEAELVAHPAVHDAAVIGVPDDEWGERVHAVVELGGEVDPDDLLAWCRERLAGFKCPRTIEVVDALPREASGKLKKRLLRDRHRA